MDVIPKVLLDAIQHWVSVNAMMDSREKPVMNALKGFMAFQVAQVIFFLIILY